MLTAALGLACTPVLARIARSWRLRGEVAGDSMTPAFRPGDWILADPDAYRLRGPRPGELVVVPDPRAPSRWLMKRVRATDPGGWLELAGDNAERSTDSRAFGAVDPATVLGGPWLRYWPPSRWGLLHDHGSGGG